jgi:hypothetical protein
MRPDVILIGVGTGRCGTVSLQNLLARQPGTQVTHESRPLSWTASPPEVDRQLAELCERRAEIAGDVCFSYLPHVPQLLKEPRVRVIALERDCDATVRSYEAKAKDRNHWQTHDGSRWRLDGRWDPCFPKFPSVLSREAAIRAYWEQYYAVVRALVTNHPDRVRCFDLNALNDESGVAEILDHCDVHPTRRRIVVGVHQNSISRIEARTGRGRAGGCGNVPGSPRDGPARDVP